LIGLGKRQFLLGDRISKDLLFVFLLLAAPLAIAESRPLPFGKYMYDLGRALRKADPLMMRQSSPALSDERLDQAIEGVEETIALSGFMIDCEGKLEMPERLTQGRARVQLEHYTREYLVLLEQYKVLLLQELAKPFADRSFESLDRGYHELNEMAVQAHQNI